MMNTALFMGETSTLLTGRSSECKGKLENLDNLWKVG